MINVTMLCATMAGGFSCLPMTGDVECATALTLLHQGVIIESECTPVEMRAGSIYAPDWSPIPVARP